MRKVTVTLEPSKIAKKVNMDFMKQIESFEVLQLLRLDFEKGIKVAVVDYRMKPGVKLEDLKMPKNLETISVLKEEKDRYLVVIKVNIPKSMMGLMRLFDLDLVWDLPMHAEYRKVVFSAIGREENLKKFIKYCGLMGKVKSVSYQKAVYQEHNLLSTLTDKQREVIIAAKRNGYYDYPKRINSKELAERVGLSKATVIEHLRKAEGRLVENILAGY